MKKRVFTFIITIIIALTTVFLLVGCESETTPKDLNPWKKDYISTLTKEKGKEFKILQLSDIQANSNYTLRQQQELISGLIEQTKPDYIVLNGDSTDWGGANVTVANGLVRMMDGYKIPWGLVYGNHDNEGAETKDKEVLDAIYENSSYGLFNSGEESLTEKGKYGGNYIVNVAEGNDIVWSIFMLDSGSDISARSLEEKGLSKNHVSSASTFYDYVQPSIIEWYEEYVKKIAELQFGEYDKSSEKVVKSFAFFHIPLCEMYDCMYNVVESEYLMGVAEEGCSCSMYNSGLFDKACDLGSTKGFFFGHDHLNNIFYKYKGITMGFGTKTGTGNYHSKKIQGGTLITINAEATDFTVENIIVGSK